MGHRPCFSLERKRIKAGDYIFFALDHVGDPALFGKAKRRTREQGLETWWNWWADLDRDDYCSGMAPTLAEASEAIFAALSRSIEREEQEDLRRPHKNRPEKQPLVDHSKVQKRADNINPMKFFNKIDKKQPKGV